MYKIWVRIKGSLSGVQGYYYSTDNGIWRSTCRQEAKRKVLALYGEARRVQNMISGRYDFKVVEIY